jgi:hypothetical protein
MRSHHPGDTIVDGVCALNALGYSVGISSRPTEVIVLAASVVTTELSPQPLLELIPEGGNAPQIMNEIQEIKATLSQNNNRSTPLSVAAFHWLEHYYKPTLELLQPVITRQTDPTELYWQVLEHKWFLSERAHHDVGHYAAAEDYRRHFAAADD